MKGEVIQMKKQLERIRYIYNQQATVSLLLRQIPAGYDPSFLTLFFEF